MSEVVSIGRMELCDACCLTLKKRDERVFSEIFSRLGEMNEHASPVQRVRLPFNEAEFLKTIEPDRHSPGRQKQDVSELGWSQRADQVELGQDFEIAPMAQAV